MNETRFTSGKWLVFVSTDGFASVYAEGTYCPTAEQVGFALQGPRRVIAGVSNEDDAHLIAQAKAMYEALEEMLEWCVWDTEYAQHARKVLAAARGEHD